MSIFDDRNQKKRVFIGNHWPLCHLVLRNWPYSRKVWLTPNGRLLCRLAREELGYSVKYVDCDLLHSMTKQYEEILKEKSQPVNNGI